MTSRMCGVFFFLAATAALPAQQAGIENQGDIHKTLVAIATHADRLAPFLDQVQPEKWVAAGAPEAYIAQAKSCRDQNRSVAADARNLDRNPEKLTDALQTLFRIRALETMLASLSQGIRKYQNPPMADMLNAAVAENAANRDRLQQYCFELATEKEQEFRIADQEAQRCRASISRQPAGRDRVAPKQEKN